MTGKQEGGGGGGYLDSDGVPWLACNGVLGMWCCIGSVVLTDLYHCNAADGHSHICQKALSLFLTVGVCW